MSTHIERNGKNHYIIHDGAVYHNTIRTPKEMASMNTARAVTHSLAAKKAKTTRLREWRFTLRNRHAQRAQEWLSCL